MVIRKLIWDDWNTYHIARHYVNRAEIENVCFGSRIQINKAGDGKISVIGKTMDGRYLTIFLASRTAGNFYPISARDSALKERKLYKRKFR